MFLAIFTNTWKFHDVLVQMKEKYAKTYLGSIFIPGLFIVFSTSFYKDDIQSEIQYLTSPIHFCYVFMFTCKDCKNKNLRKISTHTVYIFYGNKQETFHAVLVTNLVY